MGFFDQYKGKEGGGSFLSSPSKQFLIENGVPFQITGVAEDPENEFGPRYVAFCLIPDEVDGELQERKVGFPTGTGVSGRDDMLAQMKVYLEDEDGEPIWVKLEKPGKAILIVPAEDPTPKPTRRSASKPAARSKATK